MDGIDHGILQKIREGASSTPGIVSIDEVRARWVGREIHAEIALAIDPALDTRSAHELSEELHHRLLHQIDNLTRVFVHFYPAGDEPHPLHSRGPHRHDGLPLHSHTNQGMSLS